VNPATEEIEARVADASPEDVDVAVQSALKGFATWRRFSPSQRGGLLLRLATLVEQHAQELGLLDTRDMGKPYRLSCEHDVPGAVELIRFYAGLCDKIRGSQIPAGPDKHVYVVREPVGVVACILPWNFPFASAVQKLAPALACGNTVVLKPAEQSPRSTLRLAELCLEAGIPPGVVNTVTGRGEIAGSALARHPGVGKISFTGSTEVGRQIMRAAAENINKVTLELGGKSSFIVFPDAPLEAAVAASVATSCYNTGQVCTSGSRLVLHRDARERFLEALASQIGKLKVGDPMQPDTKLGPLSSRDQFQRVREYVELGRQHYSSLSGGWRSEPLERGYYINPVVFDHVEPESRIAQEEIFGPVLAVIDFDDEDQGLRIANQTRYGLATSIWTRNIGRAHRMAASVDTGFVWINTSNDWTPEIPYEGHRLSGVGADMGLEVVESYTQLKSVVIKWNESPNPWAQA
jgi:acyl-CoA reductase-like NAD-dependent aldehyde dehydrogenase